MDDLYQENILLPVCTQLVSPFPPLSSYASDEIHFNLMAIVSDRKKQFEKEITELERKKELAAKKVCASLTSTEITKRNQLLTKSCSLSSVEFSDGGRGTNGG